MQTIADGVHLVPLGMVNAYLLEAPDGLVLVDTGFPGAADKIIAAARQIGSGRIAHIILTHAHPDHVGSLAEVVRRTGAQTWMHVDDAPLVERAEMRPVYPSAGIIAHLFYLVSRVLPRKTEAAKIDHRIGAGDALPVPGLRAIHVPGHCKGQVALLWPERQILIAADACMNVRGLTPSLLNEDEALARRSLATLATLEFERVCFGHGKPILSGAADRLRAAFAAPPA